MPDRRRWDADALALAATSSSPLRAAFFESVGQGLRDWQPTGDVDTDWQRLLSAARVAGEEVFGKRVVADAISVRRKWNLVR